MEPPSSTADIYAYYFTGKCSLRVNNGPRSVLQTELFRAETKAA
jgi:hypothetical protein